MVSHECLLVFLDQCLGLAFADHWPLESIAANSEIYVPVSSEFSGFYDWLRDSTGELIGIRHNGVRDNEVLRSHDFDYKYARIGRHGELELFFVGKKTVDPKRSVDQDFLYNQIFRSDSGAVCLSFAMSGLTSDDIDIIRQVDAEWPAVEVEYGKSS